ncbi:MAG: caspase family protein [Myxococcota bacterium]
MIAHSLLVLGLILGQSDLDAPTTVRRFAVIAAANDGGEGRTPLAHAVRDAEVVSRVLQELGGVLPEDARLLAQPSPSELVDALRGLSADIQKARGEGRRAELVLYYSGHSDARGLLLAHRRLAYADLKDALSQTPADVRIAILDSCASGAITRLKGGKRRPPFTLDASNQVRGTAILTSSSETEAAQESDAIGGSFFTHYLVSGLRGAGDLSQDGRVTLNEAYNFAFHETLARTENTMGGAQHPAYDIQLVGSGDVVMTDLRSTSAGLRVGAEASGRIFIRDAQGRLAVELRKLPGRPVVLGLEPGNYSVTVEAPAATRRGLVVLEEGAPTELELSQLALVESELTTLRGDGPVQPEERVTLPIDIGLVPPLNVNGFQRDTLNYVSFGFLAGYGHDLHGLGLSIGAHWLDGYMDGLQLSVGFNHVKEDAEGAQLAVGFDNVGGSMDGFQGSVGFNTAKRRMKGWQNAVGFNFAGGSVRGLQTAVGFNGTGEDLEGAQISLGANYTPRLRGLQLGVGPNLTLEGEGAQIGLINVATKESEGLQLGHVNYAASADFQLGLVNVVKKTKGPSIGLVNYAIDDGIVDMAFFSSDVALAGYLVELGTRHFFTAFDISTGTWEEPTAWGFGGSLGYRFYFGPRWELSIELGARAMDEERDLADPELLSFTRARVALKLIEKVRVFAGPSLNVMVDVDEFTQERAPLAPDYAFRPEDGRVYIWPGLWAGLQLF